MMDSCPKTYHQKCTEKCACGNYARIDELTCYACMPAEERETELVIRRAREEEHMRPMNEYYARVLEGSRDRWMAAEERKKA